LGDTHIVLRSGEIISVIAKLSKELIIDEDVTGFHHGQTDVIMRIGNPVTDKVYGYIQYSIYQGDIHIQMIEVYKEHQRKGYATILMNYLKETNPKSKIHNGYSTDEGHKLLKTIGKFGGI